MVDRVDAPDQIEGRVRQWRLEHISLEYQGPWWGGTASRSRVRRGEIHSYDDAFSSDLVSKPAKRFTRPATGIEHSHARIQFETRNRPTQLALSKRVESLQLRRVVACASVA
jgi:hypothetical protein